MRTCERITGSSINTISKLLKTVGKACEAFHSERVSNIRPGRIELDEMWSFVYTRLRGMNLQKKYKGKKNIGNYWIWLAMDSKSKLILSWHTGRRGAKDALHSLQKLADRLDLNHRPEISSDGLKTYEEAIDKAFGANVDYGQAKRILKEDKSAKVISDNNAPYKKSVMTHRIPKSGNPNINNISTNFIERNHLTLRTFCKRFSRDTLCFSKSLEYHKYAIALHIVYFNFCRIHKSLRITPAMEAGLADDVWTAEDIVKLISPH